jgi:hypothetical protein
MSVIHNERTKLTATLLNNLAVASIVAGGLSPLAAFAYGLTPLHRDAWIIGLLSAVWILAGTALHLIARAILGRMQA